MADVSTKLTLGNETYELISTGRTLNTTILKTSFDKMSSKSGCVDSNFLNHWFDSNELGQEVDLSTQLDTDEITIADYKSSITSPSLMEFQDNMLPVLKGFLKFAYYMELGKQWNTPLNPLNLIYVDDFTSGQDGVVKAFYHNASTLEEVDSDFLNDVIKMVMYLLLPEETNTAGEYNDYTAQNYFDRIDGSPELIAKYPEEDVSRFSDFVFNLQVDELNHSVTSVKTILTTLGADDVINEVEREQGVVPATTKPNNIVDFMEVPEENPINAQADETPAQSEQAPKKSSHDEKLEAMKKELEAKTEEKRKKKEAKKQAKQQPKPAKTQASPAQTNQASEEEDLPAVVHSGGKGKLIVGSLVALMLLGGGFYMMKSHSNNTANNQASSTVNSKDPTTNPYFKKGSLESGAQNYQDAAVQFDKYFASGANSSNLNNSEVATVFAAYLNSNNYQKILDNIGSKQTSTALVNYLTAKKNLKAVDKLNSSLPIINLVKADNKKDYMGVVNNVDGTDVSNNGPLQLDICKAFAKTKKLSDGKNWAEQQKNSTKLKKLMGAYAKQNGMSDKTIKSQLGI